ncbi:hypothetical protein QFZ24_002918 [Streptomyces phaeochromogenes]|uniref:hypothetical protein n=1 Tax=Streptomyces phaeochromogenes TaxID=1923 RepID=UPI0027926C24|nr:hypothetical protein [Streptomyces phaeochromogenes]MDQ0948995.1 hypothetical protein [Streptomyces phaeochromogenes]
MRVQPLSVVAPAPSGPDGVLDVPRRPAYRPLRLWAGRVPVLAVLAVLPLYGVWATLLATGGGDLAAQYAWAGFFARNPDSAYGLFWYGGTHTANYSVLSPPLMAMLGVRTASVLAGVAATWLLGSLLERTVARVPLWPALLGALGLWANVASGRTTFALGLAFGLAGLLAVAGRPERRDRLTAGALGALLATLASPVAGLFLLVAGAGYLLDRRYAKCLVLCVPPVVVCASTALLFPFQGEQPMPAVRMLLPLLLSGAVLWAAPRAWRVLRGGAAVYAVGVVLTCLVPSPIGTNVERLAALFAPAVLLACLRGAAGSGDVRPSLWRVFVQRVSARQTSWWQTSLRRTAVRWAAAYRATARRITARRATNRRAGALALALALAASVAWTTTTTANDLRVTTSVPAWATHTGGVLAELERLDADRDRVEVVPARNHREAALFAPHAQLMRGWNRQLDVERGRLFYEGALDAPRYHAWLRQWAVGYVVVPDGAPDGPAEHEAALVTSGQDWLEPVWHDAYWRIYRVRDAEPLVSAPARVVRAGEAAVVLRVPGPGTVTVRVRYSPWLRAAGACVRPAGPWTELTVRRAGLYRLDSSYVSGPTDEDGCLPAEDGSQQGLQ